MMESRTLDFKQFSQDKQTDYQPDTRPSTTFRSTGRQKDAHWSNRFRKDFHDLNYDVKYDLIKGKSDLNHKPNYSKNLRESKRSRSSRGSFDKVSGSSLQKYQRRVSMIKMNRIKNPQKFSLIQKKIYSTLDTQGLCKFQFQKTIEGRLVYKPNGHLQFQNQTERSVNLNPVWYKPQNQINPNKMFQRSRSNNQSHHFSSYTERRVFVPKQQLDKFYDTDKGLRLASARTIKQTCQIDGLIGRKALIPPRSSSLSYNEYDAKKKIMQKICSYPIASTKRQLKFTRQVISPERGCFR